MTEPLLIAKTSDKSHADLFLLPNMANRHGLIAGATGTSRGYAEFEAQLPAGRTVAVGGSQFHAQWLWFDPTNFQAHGSTAGQRFRVQ